MTLSRFHSFDVNIAAKYGVEEAIIIHHFAHWIGINKTLNRNLHEGRYWTYQTAKQIAANFPYLTEEQVTNIIEKLCTGKSRFSKKDKTFEPVLIKGNFNKSRYDRTVWYAFSDPEESISKNNDMQIVETQNAFCANTNSILCEHNMDFAETQNEDCGTTTPIPDPKPYTKTNRNLSRPKSERPASGIPTPGGAERDKSLFQNISEEAKEISTHFEMRLDLLYPGRKPANQEAWQKEFDKIHRIDKKSWDDIKSLLDWALDDSFWVKNILSPATLRKQWDKLMARKIPAPNKGNQMLKNRALAEETRSSFQRQPLYDKIYIDNLIVRNKDTGASISLDMPRKDFIDQFCRVFNVDWQDDV